MYFVATALLATVKVVKLAVLGKLVRQACNITHCCVATALLLIVNIVKLAVLGKLVRTLILFTFKDKKFADTDLFVKERLIASTNCFAEPDIAWSTYTVFATLSLYNVKVVKFAELGKDVK